MDNVNKQGQTPQGVWSSTGQQINFGDAPWNKSKTYQQNFPALSQTTAQVQPTTQQSQQYWQQYAYQYYYPSYYGAQTSTVTAAVPQQAQNSTAIQQSQQVPVAQSEAQIPSPAPSNFQVPEYTAAAPVQTGKFQKFQLPPPAKKIKCFTKEETAVASPQPPVQNQPANKSSSTVASQSQWPPTLKAYVERAFGNCSNDEERSKVEADLKQIITETIKNQLLWQKDWDKEPMPPSIAAKFTQQQPFQQTSQNLASDIQKKQQREKRFKKKAFRPSKANFTTLTQYENELNWDQQTIKGTCQDLEKSYLRLTGIPDPSTVRPEIVLKKAFEFWKEKEPSEDYLYICEQFKSIRQDLMVQQIKNEFTVDVYETHARIALKNDDIGEFNQCQTQLSQLYASGIRGNVMEFFAYRLLYNLYQRNSVDIGKLLKQLTPEHLSNPAVKHALKVREAVSFSNYHSFFVLYKNIPNMGKLLMDKLVNDMRKMAVQLISKAFRPGPVPISWVENELDFSDELECMEFLQSHDIALDVQKKLIVWKSNANKN